MNYRWFSANVSPKEDRMPHYPSNPPIQCITYTSPFDRTSLGAVDYALPLGAFPFLEDRGRRYIHHVPV